MKPIVFRQGRFAKGPSAIWSHWLLVLLVLLTACSKEMSFESDGTTVPPPEVIPGGGTAEGIVVGNGGTCGSFVLTGTYIQSLTLDTSNRLRITVDITKTGTYSMSTDTLNGIHFAGSGTLNATGLTEIVLQGFGTPLQAGLFSYQWKWKGSNCTFQIEFLPLAVAGTGDYFPMTTGSNWTYKDGDPTADDSDTLRILSTGLQGTTTGGTVFNLFTTDFGASSLDSSLYRKQGNDYRELGDIDVGGFSNTALIDDFIFLRDDQPVGTKWETRLLEGPNAAGSGLVRTKRSFEIVARNVRVAVNGKGYNNVIKVKISQLVENTPGNFVSALVYETWFARGIGLINIQVPAPIYGYGLIKHTVL